MADPFSEIHDAIWATLEASSAFTALVSSGGRFKLGSDALKRGAFDGTSKAAAMPALIVYMDPTRNRVIDSSGTELATVWNFDLRYADERVTEQLYPVMWAIYRAMAAASIYGSTLRSAVTFTNAKVVSCAFVSSSSQFGPVGKAAAVGWRTVWAYEVTMIFPTAGLPPP